MQTLSTPPEVAALGQKWIEAFRMMVKGESKAEANRHLGISSSTFYSKVKSLKLDEKIEAIRIAEAKTLDEQFIEDAQKARNDASRLTDDIQRCATLLLEEKVIRGVDGQINALSEDFTVRDLETLAKTVKTSSDTRFKATGVDKTEKIEIATAGKSQTAIQFNMPKGAPSGDPSQFRAIEVESNKVIETHD